MAYVRKGYKMSTYKYCEYSESIRQMPENYLIAHKSNRAWLCEPDLAANMDFATRVFRTINHSHANKYLATGEQIIEMALKLEEVQP